MRDASSDCEPMIAAMFVTEWMVNSAKSELGRSTLRVRIVSRIQVDFVSIQAFQYRWNCSSLVGLFVMLRQVTRSDPVNVRVRGSSTTEIV